MLKRRRRHTGKRRDKEKELVFLNIPYDKQFIDIFLAYVTAIRAFGLLPRATLEIPGSGLRLDRIAALIRSCKEDISVYAGALADELSV